MKIKLNKNDLIQFEEEVAQNFNEAKIKAPVHLYFGNEDYIIKVFEKVNEDDWIFCSWRSHYQCLLKGVPKEILMKKILEGKSISLCFPEFNIYSSAIVGGVLPIAVGVAMNLKNNKRKNNVFCFMGDMTSETGIAHESIKYSQRHDLPITFVIEDNEKSVMTDTRETWNIENLTYQNYKDSKIIYYSYKTKYPHAGAGTRVQF